MNGLVTNVNIIQKNLKRKWKKHLDNIMRFEKIKIKKLSCVLTGSRFSVFVQY